MELKNFNIFGIYWKIWVLGGRVHENQYKGRDYLKTGLGEFADLKGTWQEKRGGGGVDSPMHTLSGQNNLKITTSHFEKKCLVVITKNKKTFTEASCTNNIHIEEKVLYCCHFVWK